MFITARNSQMSLSTDKQRRFGHPRPLSLRFLIAFAFSGAVSRFIDRMDIIVKEANALRIGYLRADTIAEPQRGELKAALKEYTADRVTLLSHEGRDQTEPLLAKVSGLHARIWRSAIKPTQDNAPLMAVVLPPINEVIDLHSAHLPMARRSQG